jgi:hypothetical protein
MSLLTLPGTDREVDLATLPLRSLANIIWYDWRKAKSGVYFGAEPYISAMMALETINDYYGVESGEDIVRYFLSNAKTWRGDVAKAVKAELRSRVGL